VQERLAANLLRPTAARAEPNGEALYVGFDVQQRGAVEHIEVLHEKLGAAALYKTHDAETERVGAYRRPRGEDAHVSMPGVHRGAAPLKRWILGTHQGSVTPAHLQSCPEVFTFRFNRRSSGSRGLVFRRLIEQAVVAGPLTEAELTFGYDWSRSQGRRS
jgi:hypothetical protein